ncbi:hypothetical protein DCAR_0311978 [Daucus carota subsp. sativus]|uniref:Ubiquitin-like protease family profile domain-containing protein n=1 Tax=Daucus carota subsp. sativus TaxID=79200 RepID=A0AAF0WN75_DAUCS|nr:hypothetical protein DCAR_0310293 [Daucus carota subsp. sativus]WOG92703.1 hypothetical protein DCAR_0311978 [Daucus carota subsp. sativus]
MIPSKLAYNVFQIFEHNSLTLKLKNKDVNIVEEDVFDVLGLPHEGQTILLRAQNLIEEKLLFDTDLKIELQKNPESYTLQTIQKVFFPIHKYDHFYLITYHLKKTTYEIIDNIKRDEHEEICYGEVPDMLHTNFIKYLQAKGLSTLTKKLHNMKPTLMKMPWQTKENHRDCGIFLMRHMETYKGDPKNWETGFKNEVSTLTLLVRFTTNC